MKNNRLNPCFIIKINIPIIRKVIKDAEEFIQGTAVKVYFEKNKWRWDIRKTSEQAVQPSAEALGKLYGPPPYKRRRTLVLIDLADKGESQSNTDDCSKVILKKKYE